MLNSNILLTFCLSLTTLLAISQQPAHKLNDWSGKNPIEKVYLHTDREEYLAGQTIWFKAYLNSGFIASDQSTTLYVELVSPSANIVATRTLPIVRSVTQGQFELPDTLSSGTYFIRAYTAIMLNHDVEYLYKRSLSIIGKKQLDFTSPAETRKIRMEFFPEGGNFVTGLSNTIAFKATDQTGLPVNVNGILKNSKNEVLSEFTSYHDGMGMIEIDSKESETYYVELKNEGAEPRYNLPASVNKGVVFRLMNGNDGIHFEILQKKSDPDFQAAYMIGQMQNTVIFKQPLREGQSSLTGVIKTSNLSSGILHITVFNKNNLPLAERLSFINNKEYLQIAELVTDTTGYSARKRNRFSVAFKDTVIGSFSVSVTDPDYDATARRQDNIVSRFLLTSDLNGYIHNPTYYFSTGNDSAVYAMDLVMMTNGWRRFRWSQILNDSLPSGKYRDAGFITLKGRVNLEGTKKPFADKEMLVFIVGPDSTRTMQMIKTDADGNYRLDSLIFFGKANILFSDIKGRKSKFVDIKPGSDSLNRSYFLPPINKKGWPGTENFTIKKEIARKLVDEYDAFLKATGLVLGEVVVTSRKKSALEELEEKYTTGAFSGETRRTFDLTNKEETLGYLNIFDYLQARVPGITTGRTDDGDYFIYYRQTATISSLGNQGMDIFLDEVPTDANTVAFINPSQIALVKVYSTFVGSSGGGAGGALAIYMKKGADYFNSIPSAGESITASGYSVIKEFYSPNYKVSSPDHSKADNRLTLYWKPDMFVNGINPKIPFTFYNNDRTKAFKIIVEGMTVDGKLLVIEKLVGQ